MFTSNFHSKYTTASFLEKNYYQGNKQNELCILLNRTDMIHITYIYFFTVSINIDTFIKLRVNCANAWIFDQEFHEM